MGYTLVRWIQLSILKKISISKSMDCKWYNAINFSILNVIGKIAIQWFLDHVSKVRKLHGNLPIYVVSDGTNK